MHLAPYPSFKTAVNNSPQQAPLDTLTYKQVVYPDLDLNPTMIIDIWLTKSIYNHPGEKTNLFLWKKSITQMRLSLFYSKVCSNGSWINLMVYSKGTLYSDPHLKPDPDLDQPISEGRIRIRMWSEMDCIPPKLFRGNREKQRKTKRGINSRKRTTLSSSQVSN